MTRLGRNVTSFLLEGLVIFRVDSLGRVQPLPFLPHVSSLILSWNNVSEGPLKTLPPPSWIALQTSAEQTCSS